MADEEIEYDRGYCSIEEHMLDCMDFFLRLQKCREKQEPEENRAQIEGQDPERILELQEVREEVRDFRKLAADIAERERSTQIFLPALYLRENCGLAESEYWLVLFAFCCELESGLCLQFWKQYNNMWPTIQYALHLLSDVFPADFALIAKLCGQKHPIGDILEMSVWQRNYLARM